MRNLEQLWGGAVSGGLYSAGRAVKRLEKVLSSALPSGRPADFNRGLGRRSSVRSLLAPPRREEG